MTDTNTANHERLQLKRGKKDMKIKTEKKKKTATTNKTHTQNTCSSSLHFQCSTVEEGEKLR